MRRSGKVGIGSEDGEALQVRLRAHGMKGVDAPMLVEIQSNEKTFVNPGKPRSASGFDKSKSCLCEKQVLCINIGT